IVATGLAYTAYTEEQQPPAPVYQAPASAPVKTEGSAETSMKVTKDSGGTSLSSLIHDAPLSSDYVMGAPEAPLVMIEYASMSCPHCAHFSNTVLPELEKKYIQTGKMKYILRQFPLNE